MRRTVRWGVIVLATAMTLVGLAADSSGVLAAESTRTDTWELIIPVRYFPDKNIEFDHGTNIDLHDDIGWGFGFGYNFNEHSNIDFEMGWTNANYKVEFASADNPPKASASATGSLDVFSSQFNFTYNFMAKTVTPYVSAGLGWNWLDTNIPTGPPQTGCWWDPWYGYICNTYQDTASEQGFNYGFGLGVRIEPKDSFFLRFGINDNWQDFGDQASDTDILSYRLDMGWKF